MCVFVSGSIANKVFHEILFDTCLDLSSHCWPENSGKKRKKDGSKSSKADGKRSRPQRKDLTDVRTSERNHSNSVYFTHSHCSYEKCYLIIGSWFSLDGRGRRGRRRGDSSLWLRPDEDQRRLISFASKSPQTPADTFTQRQTAEPQ